MRRVVAVLAAVVLVASVGTGALIWWLSRDQAPQHPTISAYTDGQLTRVGPYRYCPVLDLNNCESGTQGELRVNEHDPVQLSVPGAVARAPWRLLRVYDDPDDTTVSRFRPGDRLAETIQTVDPQRGRLNGIVVQLMTLVEDETGEVFDMPHAEWAVHTVWP